VYIYRDDGEPALARPEDDPAYWYDLEAEDPVPEPEHDEGRGPFEPLMPSTGAAADSPGEPVATAGPARDDNGGAEAPERERARKLEQLQDLYLTAEAIGEQNVDRHFNELLAQQRQLISDYFSQGSAAADDGLVVPQPTTNAAEARPRAQDGTPPEGMAVRAEPPAAW
jgi:hypothetical protein